MSRVESVSLAVSPIVGQCACRHVSESNKQRNAGHRTVGRMERTVLWSVVIAGSFLVIGCLVLEVITRKQMKVLAERCLTHQGGVHTPQKNHVDVTPTKNSFANSEKQIEDMTPLDDDANSTPRTWKRHPSRKRARALRTQSSQSPTRASHFVANNDRSNDFQYSDESCIPKWDGMFCRNGTYWSDRTAQIIKFFVGSDWTRNNDFGIQSALNQSTPGMFRVQGGGLYLIYINVMIRTTEDKHDIEIYSDSTRLLRCRQGLDYVRQTTDRYLYSKTRTCSVMGLFYLEDGAVLTSRILQARTTLSLGPDSTNFGAILFTSHPQLDDFSYFG